MEVRKLSFLVKYSIYALLFAGVVYILVMDTTDKTKLFLTLPTFHHQQPSTSRLYEMSIYKDNLEMVLASASSTKNKTLIITIVNKAYVEVEEREGEGGDKAMLDLFLDGFWIGEETRQLVDNLLIVAMDNTSYERCKFLGLHCYKLETNNGEDFSDEKVYLSDDFVKMMWRRTLFLGDVLKRGYNFVFTDTDVLWLRNPFPNLTRIRDTTDIHISTDRFYGHPWSNANPINTGFYMIRSNNKTIQLFNEWYARKNSSVGGLKEQDVLQIMIFEGIFWKLRLKVEFLNTIYFSGFCQDSKNVKVVKTVHANCCRGIKAKLVDMTAVIHDWKKYKKISDNETSVSSFRWTNHVACMNSWQ